MASRATQSGGSNASWHYKTERKSGGSVFGIVRRGSIGAEMSSFIATKVSGVATSKHESRERRRRRGAAAVANCIGAGRNGHGLCIMINDAETLKIRGHIGTLPRSIFSNIVWY